MWHNHWHGVRYSFTKPTSNCVEFLLIISDRCALFALEDILGGHSAVSNIALRAMIDLGTRPATQVCKIIRFLKKKKQLFDISDIHVALSCWKFNWLLIIFRRSYDEMFWRLWMEVSFHWRISPRFQGGYISQTKMISKIISKTISKIKEENVLFVVLQAG